MNKFKFKIRGNDYNVEINKFEDNIAEIEVNGTVYNVEVKQEAKAPKTPKLVRPAVPPPGDKATIQKSAGGGGGFKVGAPLPGTVLEIKVAVGDVVKADQVLMVMEAMKMENDVLAEKAGTIKAIHVQAGGNVLQGDTLIEIG